MSEQMIDWGDKEFYKCFSCQDPGPERYWKMPKFFEKEEFCNISLSAMVLYTYMLDRLNLSVKNKLCDKEGFAYIYYTIDETMKSLKCSRNTAVKAHRELENYGLIHKSNYGGTHPSKIYVMVYIGEY